VSIDAATEGPGNKDSAVGQSQVEVPEFRIRLPRIPFKKAALYTVAGLALYSFYLYLVGFNTVAAGLTRINPLLVALTLLVALCGSFFHALNWWLYLNHLKCRISPWQAYLVSLSSNFFSSIIPSAAISGEIVKIYAVRKCDPASNINCIVAAGVVHRLPELIPVATGAILGITYLTLYYNLPPWAIAACVLIAVMVSAFSLLALALSMNLAWMQAAANILLGVVKRIFRGHDLAKISAFVETAITQYDASFKEISASRPLLLKSLAIAFVSWALDLLVIFVSFAAVGSDVPAGVTMSIYSVMMLVAMIPTFVPGGLGIVDGVMNLLYGKAGVPDAFGGTFVSRLVTFWFMTAIGGLCALYLALTMKSTPPDKNC
jgi:glycosyltransferase 2 family protein